jgi:aminoglycoside 3-N-acetyltransferase
MPAFSADYSEASHWKNPPVPESWWQTIRDTMPAFDPQITPTRHMGAIVETFRKFPGVRRSSHPTTSFAAWGKHNAYVTEKHSLEFPLGEDSPLARIYDLSGSVLLLGVGHDSNTSLHLGESRCVAKKIHHQSAPILEDGRRVWATFKEYKTDDSELLLLGEQFARTGGEIKQEVGAASASLMHQPTLVDFVVKWLKNSLP